MKEKERTNLSQRSTGRGTEYLENSSDVAVDVTLSRRSERADTEDKSRERYYL